MHVYLANEEFDQLYSLLDENRDGLVQKDEFIKGLVWIQKVLSSIYIYI